MCVIPSWIDNGSQIYYLNDKTIVAWHDEHCPGQQINWDNFTGHAGIKVVYPGIKGAEKEGFPCPPEIISDILRGNLNRLLSVGDVVLGDYNHPLPQGCTIGGKMR